MKTLPTLRLGACCPLDGGQQAQALHLPAHHLVTHGVVVGMTGSGKTGLLTAHAPLVRDARRALAATSGHLATGAQTG